MDVDERQADAVAARIELDLRIGAAFTRLQTLSLQKLGDQMKDLLLSYGRFRDTAPGVADSFKGLASSRR